MRKWSNHIWINRLVIAFFLLVAFHARSQAQSHTVYIKLESGTAQTSNGRVNPDLLSISDLSNRIEVVSADAIRYNMSSTLANGRVIRQKSEYLEGIYRLELSNETDTEQWLVDILSFPNVKYAVADHAVDLLLVPNDPQIASQSYLDVIKAYDAWNVTQGDPNIVIAISDNGSDYAHEDLVNKVAYNESDPVNGIDDDNNGYVDDYLGWDLADNDNDPFGDTPNSNPSHGTLVAGIAAAEANNSIGVAGVGYKTTFLPLKVFKTSSGSAVNSYESIIYAADQGCDVINLSWGSAGFNSALLQDMINYAVLEKDVVVVAAAGNTNADLDFYPASYDLVLSVGMTNDNDEKNIFATYSYKIDLMAPGGSVYGPANNDNYEYRQGSSFSSPQVAATAALVRSTFPEMNAIQIMEQIRMTTDDIYDVGSNSDYEGKLGKGRLNVYRAVSTTDVASMRSFDYTYSGPFGNLLFREDTVEVDISFVNILRPVENATVNISSVSPYVEILNNEIALGSLNEFDTLDNVSIKILLTSDTPPEETIGFRMDYSDAQGYEDFEYFEFTTAPSFIEMDNQNIELTVGSDGRLGYATEVMDDGIGLKYNSQRRSNFMGIIVGNHEDSISDNVINSFDNFTFEDDMASVKNIKFIEREDADYYSLGTLSDNNAENSHGLLIEQEFLSWSDAADHDYMVLEYRVTNTRDFAKANMKFGLYMDFNIDDSTKNFVVWDAANKLAYTRSDDDPDLLVGVALITDQTVIVNAIDLFDQNENPIDVTSDFTDQLKYDFLNTEKTSAGGASGYDVAQLVTADLGTFAAFSSEKIAYALVFGSDATELVDNVNKAKVKYLAFLNSPPLNMVVGTCEEENLMLGNSDPMSVYTDVLGTDLIDSGTDLDLGVYNENTFLYFKEITGGYESDIYKMQVTIANPQTNFKASPEVLYLDDDPDNEVQFQDLSLGAVQWSWDFDNGYFSSLKNPRTSFDQAGSYQIDFTSSTTIGCEESISVLYEVRERGDAPDIDDQTICFGEEATIAASNSDELRFYNTESSENAFHEGASYTVASLTSSITYYVSSVADENESVRIPVSLTVDPIDAGFSYAQDTVDLTSATLVRIEDESVKAADIIWTINNANHTGGDSFVFEYQGLSSLTIEQEVSSDNGCPDSEESTIFLEKSSKGGIEAQEICEWESVVAEPQFGEVFVFYLDEEKSLILGKGRSIDLGPITTDTSFYISNITDYLESDLIEFEVNVDEFETQIVADPEILLLDEGRNATFSINSSEVVSTYWSQSDGQQSFVSAPNFTYLESGDYILTAISENANACQDTATIDYKVYEVLDASGNSIHVTVFPNPATHSLYLNGWKQRTQLKIIDTTGKSHLVRTRSSHAGHIIDISHLQKGVYLLQGNRKGAYFNHKFVKQ